MRRLIDGLYILIMAALFTLAGWSFLFGGIESTMVEDMVLMIFMAALTIVMICTVLLDKENEKEKEMNGFKIQSQAYRKAAEQGQIEKDFAEKSCRVFDFLAGCDQEDIYSLFDSSVFNDIATGYLDKTLSELISEGVIDEKQGKRILLRMNTMFDLKSAKNACEG